MVSWLRNVSALTALLIIAGCGTMAPDQEIRQTSPTAALLRGEIATDQYLAALKDVNERARADAQFEVNREPTRAFNTRTQRVEYVPQHTRQFWNESTQRWEFNPDD